MTEEPTHIAFSDESYTTASRYRSVAVVTLELPRKQTTSERFRKLLDKSGVSEFKWEKLGQARERFAALKMIDEVIELTSQHRMRVDVLIWDTHDSRHRVPGRDDVANLQRMYYHLFKNVLQHRWPSETTWRLCPDENSALDWVSVLDYLDQAGTETRIDGDLLDERGFRLRLARDFSILQISEVTSSEMPLTQLADLFAGLGAYSYISYGEYQRWVQTQSGQMALDLDLGDSKISLSNRDRERCLVMKYLNDHCRRHKLGVGLNSSKGFRTYNPDTALNFWLYEPQHPDDKAPLRSDDRPPD